MTRNLVVPFGLAMSIILTAGTLQAQQDSLLADLYGRGVHAYFVGDLDTAHKLLSEAIDQKTQDPRCYYFRGVTYAKMGRPEQATKDFAAGATLEAQDLQKVFPVNRSLQRVQGKVRLALETHRKEARLALRKYEEERKRVRYEALKEAEKDVLRGGQQPTPANAPKLPDDARIDANNPFSGEGAVSLGGGTAKPTQQVQAVKPSVAATRRRQEPAAGTVTNNNPVATQPAAQPAARPAGDNPFGGAPAAKPAAANPFGGAPAAAKPAAANPFGGAPAAQPAAKPAAANPFGAAPGDDVKADDAKEAPANPFGAAPAAQPKPEEGAKKGGALGALFRAVSKSIPGGDAGDKPAVEKKANTDLGVEGADPAAKPAAKPAANPFGANPNK